jgi:hypothetical protein
MREFTVEKKMQIDSFDLNQFQSDLAGISDEFSQSNFADGSPVDH